MPGKPNFTGAEIVGDEVRVGGTSDDIDIEDILDIRVTLVQGERAAGDSMRGAVAHIHRIGSVWNVRLPVADPEGKQPDFAPGDVVAFGIETRKENLTTTTWVETLKIT